MLKYSEIKVGNENVYYWTAGTMTEKRKYLWVAK